MQKSKFFSKFWGVFLFVGFGLLVFLMAASSQQELIYSTRVEGQGCGIAVDDAGFAYVARFAGPKNPGNPGGISTVVSKIDAAGNGQPEWSTWMGGSARKSHDLPGEVDMDDLGNIYIAGRTDSPDFLGQDPPYQIDNNANYLVMLSNEGQVLYSTVFGNYDGDMKVGVGVGGPNDEFVYLAGSSDDDVLLAKFERSGNTLVPGWSLSLGGSALDYAQSVAVDSQGNAYLTGLTKSTDLTDQNGDPVILKGTSDVFVAKFSSAGNLLYLTILGGNEDDRNGNIELGFGIALNEVDDGQGNISAYIYIAGRVTSTDFPTTPGAVYPAYIGNRDAFLAVLEPISPNDYSLLYSTYLGGSDLDRGRSVDVDSAGVAYVSAWTASDDVFTTLDAYKPDSNGDDAFLWVIDPGIYGPDSLISATYFGGSRADRGRGIRVHSDGSVYMAGMTGSDDFPLTPNFYLDTHAGFVSVLAWPVPNDPPLVTISSPADGATFSSGETVNFVGTANDAEDGDLTFDLVWNSNIDNADPIGYGGSFSTSTLSDGEHTITATVIDYGGKTGSASITITVGEPVQPETISVASIEYEPTGRGNRDLQITCTLFPTVGGAIVSIELYRDGSLDKSFSGTTDSNGVVSFKRNKAKNGTYTSVVIDVTADGYEWDGVTPPNSFTK